MAAKQLRMLSVFCALCAITLAFCQTAPSPASAASADPEKLEEAVSQGVAFMAAQAQMNLQAVRALQKAIASGNLTGAASHVAMQHAVVSVKDKRVLQKRRRFMDVVARGMRKSRFWRTALRT